MDDKNIFFIETGLTFRVGEDENVEGRWERETLMERERFLPLQNISKIMKRCSPNKGKISRQAKITIQECVSEFISFITSEAVENCCREKRKIITGDDILKAMSNLDFDNYLEPLSLYLQKYRSKTHGSCGESLTGTGSTLAECPRSTGITPVAEDTSVSESENELVIVVQHSGEPEQQ